MSSSPSSSSWRRPGRPGRPARGGQLVQLALDVQLDVQLAVQLALDVDVQLGQLGQLAQLVLDVDNLVMALDVEVRIMPAFFGVQNQALRGGPS
jgi:hypothetical protein